MTADAITDTVADMAATLGWMVHHARPARTAKGWRTAIRGHQGFPDLVLVHPRHGIIFAECKGVTNPLTQEQKLWRDTIGAAVTVCYPVGVVRWYSWRPGDLTNGHIELVLRGGGR
jgi:hypothetical protein